MQVNYTSIKADFKKRTNMLSEMSQLEKDMEHIISLICRIKQTI